MGDMALYAREDGLLEPRAPKAVEFVKEQAGNMLIADISHNTRTSLQNKFLNGWVYTNQIVNKLKEAGIQFNGIPWTRDSIHAVMQDNFLVKEEFILKGKHIKVYESTASMSRKRFVEYINDEIKPFVRDMWSIEISDPREGFYEELLREIMK